MHNSRILVEGAASWLHYENVCKRDHMFNETYLRYPIAQILQAHYGNNVEIEYPHPILSHLMQTKGDKRRIDFVVLDESEQIKLAIETKWVNRSNYLIESLISDAIRLEMLAHDYGTTSFIILGIGKENMRKFSQQKKIAPHPKNYNSHPILPLEKDHQSSIWLNPPPKYRKEILQKACEPYIGIKIPNVLFFKRTVIYPEHFDRTKTFMLFGWRIESHRNRECFYPESVFEY
jgi:hypothetical protein